MKQALPWLVVVGCLGGVVGFLIGGQRPTTTAGTPIQAAAPVPEDRVIVHTFEDDASMDAFKRLWQEGQAIRLRATTLEGYWNAEQANLAQLNDQLNSQYGIDPQKSYFLDRDARLLRERPAPAEGDADAEEGEGAVIHTFDDEEGLNAFTTLWQQQQGITLRMTVLQAYWNREQGFLNQLNDRLSADYSMDVTKNYSVDTDRRILLEVPAPAPVSLPAEPELTGAAVQP